MAREGRRPSSDKPDKAAGGRLSVPERLDLAVLREVPTLTAAEAAAEAGITIDQARRLWRALGFAEMGTERAFTSSDVDAVSAMISVVDAGTVDFDMAVNLVRGAGQMVARLADWEVATLAARVEELEAGEEATGSRIGSALRLIEELGGPFEQMLIYSWRRHLAAALARMEAMGAAHDDLHTIDVTVGFADLVSFTALSNQLDREQIGDLVEKFETRCQDVVSVHGGRTIKSLGDSVLFVLNEPVAAIEVAEGIINVIGRDPRMPDVRVGLASGPVVPRLGDVFGPPVNLAARLTAVARRNRLIIDQATADLLPEADFESRRLPARPVHGFGLVEPVAVRRR